MSVDQMHGTCIYCPLPNKHCIRLLCLAPGAFEAPISGHFIVKDMKDDNISYEALSYEWGLDACDHRVSISDHEVFTKKNLFEALQHLPRTDEERILWIDAICINQDDLEERAEQVRVMDEVYARASNVIIWLGITTHHTEAGMYVLRHLASYEELVGERVPWFSRDSQQRSDLKWGLDDIASQGYWQRLWVVQEFVLATRLTIQRGTYHLTLRSSYDVRRMLIRIKFAEISPQWRHAGLHECDLSGLIEMLEQRQDNFDREVRQEKSLLELVHKFRHLRVQNKVDLLYGLLALAPARTRNALSVDYRLTEAEVFQDSLRVIEQKMPTRWAHLYPRTMLVFEQKHAYAHTLS